MSKEWWIDEAFIAGLSSGKVLALTKERGPNKTHVIMESEGGIRDLAVQGSSLFYVQEDRVLRYTGDGGDIVWEGSSRIRAIAACQDEIYVACGYDLVLIHNRISCLKRLKRENPIVEDELQKVINSMDQTSEKYNTECLFTKDSGGCGGSRSRSRVKDLTFVNENLYYTDGKDIYGYYDAKKISAKGKVLAIAGVGGDLWYVGNYHGGDYDYQIYKYENGEKVQKGGVRGGVNDIEGLGGILHYAYCSGPMPTDHEIHSLDPEEKFPCWVFDNRVNCIESVSTEMLDRWV